MKNAQENGIIDECFLIWVKIMEQAGKDRQTDPPADAHAPGGRGVLHKEKQTVPGRSLSK